MLITTKGRYALRMMVYIGQSEPESPASLRDVAKDEDISVKYLEQMARALVKAGLLKSVRGQKGGYYLAKPASEITPGDILRAAEGSTSPVPCTNREGLHCTRQDMCTTYAFWRGLDDVIDEYLDGVTLESLCQQH